MRFLLPIVLIMLSFVSVAKAQIISYSGFDWVTAQKELFLVEITTFLEMPEDADEFEQYEYVFNSDLGFLEGLISNAKSRWRRIGTLIQKQAIQTGMTFNETSILPLFQTQLDLVKTDVDFFHLYIEVMFEEPEEMPPPPEE